MGNRGNDLAQRELPIFAGGRILLFRLILLREADLRSSDGGSILIHNGPADAFQQSLLGLLGIGRCVGSRNSDPAISAPGRAAGRGN